MEADHLKIKENNLIFLLRFTICNNMLLDKLVVFFQTRYISNAYHYFLIDKNDMELWIESTKNPRCPLAATWHVAKKTGPWKGNSWGVFLSQKPEGISKCGNNIFCTSWKNRHFLFYAQECGTKIEPATPTWKFIFKQP